MAAIRLRRASSLALSSSALRAVPAHVDTGSSPSAGPPALSGASTSAVSETGGAGATAASKPAENAASDGSTDLPKARIGASNCPRVKGSAAEPASAPNNEALITEPLSSARRAKSAAISRLAERRAPASSSRSSTRPSPGAIFSSIE